MTTALILTGGGSLGAVQAGMLRELMFTGFRPDFIVGVSAGALNGAFLAADPAIATLERMTALWSRVTTRKILGLSWRSLLALASGDGVVLSSCVLSDAILSSTAISGVFPPVEIDGRRLVDGAVAHESPIPVGQN